MYTSQNVCMTTRKCGIPELIDVRPPKHVFGHFLLTFLPNIKQLRRVTQLRTVAEERSVFFAHGFAEQKKWLETLRFIRKKHAAEQQDSTPHASREVVADLQLGMHGAEIAPSSPKRKRIHLKEV